LNNVNTTIYLEIMGRKSAQSLRNHPVTTCTKYQNSCQGYYGA